MSDFQGCFNIDLKKPEQYCQALQQLVNEHPRLRKEMDRFYYTASLLAYAPDRDDRAALLNELHEQIMAFSSHIESHSLKEEQHLFELMTRYIGKENGPLAVMEHEHQTAKEHMQLFFDKFPSVDKNHSESIRDLAHHASIIFHTLTDHFLKEEEILFPLAEKLLTVEEKKQLYDIFVSLKTA
ncbi:Hemerythrin HHE cation binding domain-containing protein [Evansella caseinilytica]|uniref:Hemerythrin HHE cation binding domain-containing protein n=1 Tax=Evansella caseinilytica TaxID=1503961 RepID=A0A1H3PM05_9BACI|nr:hemerythrin domain-containing protein [Evansella caseinilytica]SDZ02087.1 Hemerythrin HHE cation binding domain-containing protein [Evansella caseinilytica]